MPAIYIRQIRWLVSPSSLLMMQYARFLYPRFEMFVGCFLRKLFFADTLLGCWCYQGSAVITAWFSISMCASRIFVLIPLHYRFPIPIQFKAGTCLKGETKVGGGGLHHRIAKWINEVRWKCPVYGLQYRPNSINIPKPDYEFKLNLISNILNYINRPFNYLSLHCIATIAEWWSTFFKEIV